MKYLRRAWANSELSDEECEAAAAEYRADRAVIIPQLPAPHQEFEAHVDIHDGLPCGISLDRRAKSLELRLLCGDAEPGYFELIVHYTDVRIDTLDVALLEVIAWEPRSEALYREVGIIEPGWYVHRWLWWPYYRELDIEFGSFSYSRMPRPNRTVTRPEVMFREIVVLAG